MILSCVVLTQYSSVTDGRKDASAVANARLALHAVACRLENYGGLGLGLGLDNKVLFNITAIQRNARNVRNVTK